MVVKDRQSKVGFRIFNAVLARVHACIFPAWGRCIATICLVTGVGSPVCLANVGPDEQTFPAVLPSLPGKQIFQDFLRCNGRPNRIGIRVSAKTYALAGDKWSAIDSRKCPQKVFPTYITQGGASVHEGGAIYHISLSGSVLSSDTATDISIDGPRSHGIISISQSVGFDLDRACRNGSCEVSERKLGGKPVVVECYALGDHIFIIVRSFDFDQKMRFSLIPISFLESHKRSGSLRLRNIWIAWKSKTISV